MAKTRYGRKKGKKAGGHRKHVSAKRRAAGKRLWALMKSRHGGHAGAVAYLKRCRNRGGAKSRRGARRKGRR